MQEIRSTDEANKARVIAVDQRRDLLFLTVLAPISIVSFAFFFLSTSYLSTSIRTIFVLAPMIAGGVWLAYEQMHDLVWWHIRPLCPTCRRSYNVNQRPKPGMICDCCDTPLYPLRTPQDYKVIVLITTLTVVALPVFVLWSSLVGQLG